MHCVVCFSEDFREDGGFYFCTHCHTQSQDFFAESFENEERTVGPIRKRRQPTHAAAGNTKSREDPDVYHYLLLVQNGLRVFTKSTAKILGNRDLARVVRDLWFSYLKTWHASKELILNTENIRKVHHFISEKSNWVAVMPSKITLLGFVYLALRLLRSWVLPSDLVRWCWRGKIPFVNLVDHLSSPSSPQTKSLVDRFPTVGYMLQRESEGHMHSKVTPANIFFHACSLASFIGTPFPPLNMPLAALSVVCSLGLPVPRVWDNLTRMIRCLQVAPPHRTLSSLDQHHPEHICVLIAMACRLSPGWMEWTLEHCPEHLRSPYGSVHPSPLMCADRISPGNLDSVLASLESVGKESHHFRDEYPGSFSFNKPLKKALAEVKLLSSDRFSRSDLATSSACSQLPYALEFRDKHAPPEAKLDKCTKKVKDAILRFDPAHRECITYPATFQSASVLPAQYICLVERLASCFCLPPGLVHHLLEEFDEEITIEEASCVDREVAKIKRWSRRSSEPPVFSHNTDVDKYEKYYAGVLPQVQRFSRRISSSDDCDVTSSLDRRHVAESFGYPNKKRRPIGSSAPFETVPPSP